jgi:hypothetical protein
MNHPNTGKYRVNVAPKKTSKNFQRCVCERVKRRTAGREMNGTTTTQHTRSPPPPLRASNGFSLQLVANVLVPEARVVQSDEMGWALCIGLRDDAQNDAEMMSAGGRSWRCALCLSGWYFLGSVNAGDELQRWCMEAAK